MTQQFKCPIKLDKIHCQNCYFNPTGKCRYAETTKTPPTPDAMDLLRQEEESQLE